MKKYLNLIETARHFGVSRQTVDTWIKNGCPVRRKANQTRGLTWQLDPDAVQRWRDEKQARRSAGAGQLDPDDELAEAQRRKVIAEAARLEALARIEELKLAEQLGVVVQASTAIDAVATEYARVRARLLALPARLAPVLVSITDVKEAQKELKTAVMDALDELSLDSDESCFRTGYEVHKPFEGDDERGAETPA